MGYTGRTWVDTEAVTAAKMNTLRDDIAICKTDVNYQGSLLQLFSSHVYNIGQSSSGTSDTPLTSYNVTLPSELLVEPGDALFIEGTFTTNVTAGARTGRLAIASTKVTMFTSTATSAAHLFRLTLRRRVSSTSASLTGVTWTAAAGGGVTSQEYECNTAMSGLDWTAQQTLAIWAQAAGGTMTLTDYHVRLARVPIGVTI